MSAGTTARDGVRVPPPGLAISGTTPLLGDLVRTARPRQWIKNVLVFAAPGSAGVLTHPDVLVRTLATLALFCLAASGTYFLNDSLDAPVDRLHPTKQHRPIAAGRIPADWARFIAIALLSAGIALSGLMRPQLAAVTAVYAAITVSYTLWLKHEAVLDIGMVGAGFMVRVIAGGVATGVHTSGWLLIVTFFGALFMVTGKRQAEQAGLGEGAFHHRATLARYSPAYLRYVRSVSSSMVIVNYCLWMQSLRAGGNGGFWVELTVAPLVLAILRYSLILDIGGGGAPEDVVLADRPLQVMGLIWLALCAAGLYAH